MLKRTLSLLEPIENVGIYAKRASASNGFFVSTKVYNCGLRPLLHEAIQLVNLLFFFFFHIFVLTVLKVNY